MRLTRREALKTVAALAAPVSQREAGPRIPKVTRETALPTKSSERASSTDVFAKYGLMVNPRSSWVPKNAKPPVGLRSESAVKVLLIHHSDSSNSYEREAVPRMIEGFLRYHTGPDKGWPDIAYNFFVDRFGGVWEGRSGSLRSPVAGSATGGNQGSSQLICLIGNHATEPPSDAAVSSLTKLLAGLSERYGLSPLADATTSFVSQGSNRWPAGSKVTTHPIEGHRAVSMTACPGDAAFALLPSIRTAVYQLRKG